MKNANSPAMPLSVALNDVGDRLSSEDTYDGMGLTKLEYIAAQNMNGFLAQMAGSQTSVSMGELAKLSVLAAVALLDELENVNKPEVSDG